MPFQFTLNCMLNFARCKCTYSNGLLSAWQSPSILVHSRGYALPRWLLERANERSSREKRMHFIGSNTNGKIEGVSMTRFESDPFILPISVKPPFYSKGVNEHHGNEGRRTTVKPPQNRNKSKNDSNKKSATETHTLYGRLLSTIIHQRTVQLVRSLLSTMLVRVDVQSNHQNETNSNRNGENGNHHYSSIIVGMTTRGPESLHFVHPHALATIVIASILLWSVILYSLESIEMSITEDNNHCSSLINHFKFQNTSFPSITQGFFLWITQW